MSRIIRVGLLLATSAWVAPLAAAGQTRPAAPVADTPLPLDLFAYDRAAPLELRTTRTREVDGATVQDVEFASPAGGMASGRLVVPPGTGPFAGVLLMHGAPGTAESQIPWAARLARHGAVVLALNAPWAHRGEPPVTFTVQDSVYQVQLIRDMQRAVDVLLARDDVDPDRIGYAGGSYGAATGALLAGVETRVKAYALSMGDMGLVAHFTGEDDPAGGLPFLEPGQFERWKAAMLPIEPGRFVHRSSPAAVLFQAALRDEAVTLSDGARLQAAAGEPKEVAWYDTGHRREEPTRLDLLDFLARTIGTRPAERPAGIEVTAFDAGAARKGPNTASVTLLNRGDVAAELDVALRVEPGLWLRGRDTEPVRVTLAPGERRTVALPWVLERMTPEGFVAARVRRPSADSVIASAGWAVGYGNPDGFDPRASFELRLAPNVALWTWKGGRAAADADSVLTSRQAALTRIAELLELEPSFGATIVLYPDEATKAEQTGHHGLGWAVDGVIIEVYNEDVRLDPYHELVHIASAQLGWPPPLLDEGLAVFLSERLGARALEHVGHPGRSLAEAVCALWAEGALLPVTELLAAADITDSPERSRVSYAQAGSFVKHLADRHGLPAVRRAFAELRGGPDAAGIAANREAFATIFGMPVEAAEQAWLDALPCP